jgi:Cyclic nucleotide-binding domain
VVLANRSLRLLIGLAGAQCFVRGCLNVLVVVTTFRLLDSGPSTVGYLNAAVGAGGLVGAMAAATLDPKRLGVVFGLAVLWWGAPIAVIAAAPSLVLAMLGLVTVGTANAFEDVPLVTLLQRQAPDEPLSSVLGVLWGTAMASVALGSAVAAVVVAALGPRTALVVVGLLLPVLALASGRRLAAIDGGRPSSDRLENLTLFSPLSLATKELLARALGRVEAGAGEVVLREGAAGDLFYIVGAGRVEILRGGTQVGTVGPGGYFGEIALLYQVPRTATVKAQTCSTLYTLSAPALLSAVTGHPAATAAAHHTAAQHGAPATAHPGRTASGPTP